MKPVGFSGQWGILYPIVLPKITCIHGYGSIFFCLYYPGLSSFFPPWIRIYICKDLGAPSIKISLLGGVDQIRIYPRPSPYLADVGLFVRRPTQQSPIEQGVYMQANLSSQMEDHMLHWDDNSSPSGGRTRLTWSTNCNILLLFTTRRVDTPYVKHELWSQILESPTSFIGAHQCALLHSFGGSNITHPHD